MVAISALGVWKGIGWSMMIFLAALQGVPRELLESAAVDGAGRGSGSGRSPCPAIWPAGAFVTVMLVIGGFNVFISVILMTDGGPADSTQVLLTYMYKQAFTNLDFGYGATIAVLLTVGVFVLSAAPAAGVPRRSRRRSHDQPSPSGHASDRRRRRHGAPRATLLLIVGAGIMVLPFLYMLSTSFKSQTYVLTIPPQFIPHPATRAELPRCLAQQRLRPLLAQLARRRRRRDRDVAAASAR